jgi:gliding motility-associated-like protein
MGITNSIVQIYDRYGKLIIELNSSNYSWDGKYNSKILPQMIGTLKVRQYQPRNKGHFTLKDKLSQFFSNFF